MNILFIGYWAFHEGLTTSTILPHLQILSEFESVEKVVFTSIERDLRVTEFRLDISKVTHIPLYSSNSKNVFKNKWHDFTFFPKKLIQYCNDYQIDKIICRGAPAGALGYIVWKKTNIPFIVESFEPHAQYMLESSVWKKYDPRYLLEYYWEQQQKKNAEYLLPVAHNYKQKLIREGVLSTKIEVVPCTVNLTQFSIDSVIRNRIRKRLSFEESDIVGVYVGKFGGLYYDEEAFECFNTCYKYWGKQFQLLILSPQPLDEIKSRCLRVNLPEENVLVKKVSHDEIPDYLNSADFAFTFYTPGSAKQFLSPIKIGEYWACGLPVLISKGIGDDAEIIHKESAGLVYDNILEVNFPILEKMIKQPKSVYRDFAVKYRNPKLDIEIYKKIFS